jgi:MraZ protein
MFLGQYYHTLDNKGRLTIPVRYRELVEGGAYITVGLDQNLMVMTDDLFHAMSQKVNEKSFTDPDARLFRRILFSNIEWVEVDKAGRILIPQFLRQSIGLDTEVVVVGAGSFFEIWSPEKWAGQTAEMNAETNAKRFIDFDIPTG